MWTDIVESTLIEILYHLGALAAAFVLALPIAWERERSARQMGLRTFPLVALASTGYILVAQAALGDDPQAMARIVQGLMTGIGFLGGGAIVKQGVDVRGLATAASIWNTAAVGAAVAFDRYEIAILLSAVNFAVLRGMRPVKREIDDEREAEEEPWEEDREESVGEEPS